MIEFCFEKEYNGIIDKKGRLRRDAQEVKSIRFCDSLGGIAWIKK